MKNNVDVFQFSPKFFIATLFSIVGLSAQAVEARITKLPIREWAQHIGEYSLLKGSQACEPYVSLELVTWDAPNDGTFYIFPRGHTYPQNHVAAVGASDLNSSKTSLEDRYEIPNGLLGGVFGNQITKTGVTMKIDDNDVILSFWVHTFGTNFGIPTSSETIRCTYRNM